MWCRGGAQGPLLAQLPGASVRLGPFPRLFTGQTAALGGLPGVLPALGSLPLRSLVVDPVPMAFAALSHLRSALGRQQLWRHGCLSAPWAPLSLARCCSGGRGSDRGGRAEPRAPSLKGNYGQLCERAAREPGPFWGALARETLQWETPHHTDCEWDFAQGRIRWFLGGRLNVAGKRRLSLTGREGDGIETASSPSALPSPGGSMIIFSLQVS